LIRFSEYMTDWLYGKSGYYSKYKEIGKDGDFYTAVSSSPFFGGAIAKEIVKMISKGDFSKNSTICEIGAHKGYLIADVIQFIYTLQPELLKSLSFAIIERFEHLRNRQREYLKNSFGDEVELNFYSSLTELKRDETIFFANEIFDAFSCELVYKDKIATVSGHKITFNKKDDEILRIAKKYGKDRGEVAVGYKEFANEMKNSSNKFEFITFDYGDIEPRPDFSIRVYEKHKVFPLFEEGLKLEKLFKVSDITFDVNFAQLKDEFEDVGIEFVEFKTQNRALVDFGIIELLEILKSNSSENVYHSELNRVKILIDPAFMGERFKMIRFRNRS
jgi:SAM-dependent MidA family methyltransferase